LNPLFNDTSNNTFSEGNLKIAMGSNYHTVVSTIGVSSGKWFFEHLGNTQVGVVELGFNSTSRFGYATSPYNVAYNHYTGEIIVNNSIVATVNTYGSGDIVGCFLDFDNQQIKFYKNGSVQSYTVSFSPSGKFYHFAVGHATVTAHANFGQDHLFGGATLPSGAGSNTSDNGIGTFAFSVPSGARALCTANLPNPAIDPAVDDLPSDYMKAVTYTGNGSTQSIASVGFQPDLVWAKNRDASAHGVIIDSVRGAGKTIFSSSTQAENTNTTSTGLVLSFDSSGFSLGSHGNINGSNEKIVAWCWKAGGAPTADNSNTSGAMTANSVSVDGTLQSSYTPSGSPTIYPKRMSVNTKAGFSIVKYTGTGSAATVPHGLSAAPDIIITKEITSTSTSGGYWNFTFKDLGFLHLNATSIIGTGGGTNGVVDYNNITSSTFSFITGGSSNNNYNNSGSEYINYCWHSVAGYSAFGSYEGNGSTDGPFVYTGFKPAWLLLKNIDLDGDWWLMDTTRDTYNVAEKVLYPNLSGTEYVGASVFGRDLLSNGFKVRNNNFGVNGSYTYIYACFAEMPQKYAATNAR
jgi:hypothetical protein